MNSIGNEHRREARRRVLYVTPEALELLCESGSSWKVAEGLPKDTRIIGSGYDGRNNRLVLYIESEEFDPILEGEDYPQHHCLFARIEVPDGA